MALRINVSDVLHHVDVLCSTLGVMEKLAATADASSTASFPVMLKEKKELLGGLVWMNVAHVVGRLAGYIADVEKSKAGDADGYLRIFFTVEPGKALGEVLRWRIVNVVSRRVMRDLLLERDGDLAERYGAMADYLLEGIGELLQASAGGDCRLREYYY